MIQETPLERAVHDAVHAGRIGAPVYVRYAVEAPPGTALLPAACRAVLFAARTLGTPASVFAAAIAAPLSQTDAGRQTPGDGTDDAASSLDAVGSDVSAAHLSLTVRFDAGGVAQLSVGRQPESGGHPATPASPSLLVLGDQGVVERFPGIVADTAGAAPAAGASPDSDQALTTRITAAIRESLATGQPAVLEQIR